MHPNTHQPDDLSKLELRLADWVPAGDGLDADALLFAAGRASARPGRARFVWPALAGLTTIVAVILGVWLRHEHTERLALAKRVQQLSKIVVPQASPPSAVTPADSSPAEEEQVSSYLAARRALESDLQDWPDRNQAQTDNPEPPLPSQPVLQVGRPDVLFDP